MQIERVTDDTPLDAIVALEAESFTNPWSRETLEWELRNSDVTSSVRRCATRAGGGVLRVLDALRELHINTLAVAPAWRRRGLATTLLRHVFAEAGARGVQRATLEVRASNRPAIALYERLGFQVTATRYRYYNSPEEDALILWREGLNASS